MNILNEKSKIEKYHAFRYIFLTRLGASANFGVFRRLLASTILGSSPNGAGTSGVVYSFSGSAVTSSRERC